MPKTPGFYQSDGLNVETYDQQTAVEAAIDSDVQFYTEHARQIGDPVLELATGTGRVALALAEAGLTIVGLDSSEPMLRRAEARRAALPAPARDKAQFVRGDMADFRLDQQFALVLVAYRSFQALTSPADQRRCLSCIHRHLRTDGHLIINLFDPRLEWCVPDAAPRLQAGSFRHPVSGNLVKVETLRHTNDPMRQVLTEVWGFSELDEAGKVLRNEEEVLTLRWTHRQEMRYLFELTGFEVEAEYSDFHRSPPAYGREQIWLARAV